VAYDIRGFGETPADGPFFLEELVDDLGALLDRLRLERVVLCGLSMGGYIAQRFAIRYPRRLRGLVLADTRSEADSEEAKLKRIASLKKLKEEGVAAFARDFLPTLLSPATRETRPDLVAEMLRLIEANPATAIGNALLALASRLDSTAALAAVAVPTLLLVGEADIGFRPAMEAIAKARAAPLVVMRRAPVT
jgi:3-oxoadipate enol-lactonase